jgi:3-hydroxyisobutyrate dehydrogenase
LPAEVAMTIKANESTTTVALLGTGTMGAAMARRLRGRGLTVRAWNRTPARAEPLRADGVEVLETPRAAATGADLVVTMLADGPAVQAAMEGPTGALAGAAAGSCWLQTSTVGVLACGRFVELATRAQLPFIDAPVLGTKQPAERGELTVLAAGPGRARWRAGSSRYSRPSPARCSGWTRRPAPPRAPSWWSTPG